MKTIAYFSKTLWPAQQNNEIPDKEILWAVVLSLEHFCPIVLDQFVAVFCDQRSVRWLLNQDWTGKFFHYGERLSSYDFTVAHVEGRKNTAADYLSRHVFFNDQRNDKERCIVHDEQRTNLLHAIYEKHRLEFQVLKLKECEVLFSKLLKKFCLDDRVLVKKMFHDFLQKNERPKSPMLKLNEVQIGKTNETNEIDNADKITIVEGEILFVSFFLYLIWTGVLFLRLP